MASGETTDGCSPAPQGAPNFDELESESYKEEGSSPFDDATTGLAGDELQLLSAVDMVELDTLSRPLLDNEPPLSHEQVRARAVSMLKANRTRYLLKKKAKELEKLKADFPFPDTLPTNALGQLIEQLGEEQGWRSFLPAVPVVVERLYCDLDESEPHFSSTNAFEFPTSPEKTSTSDEGCLFLKQFLGLKRPREEYVVVSDDDADEDIHKDEPSSSFSSDVKRESNSEAEKDSFDESLNGALHQVFKSGVRGPLNSEFKRSAVRALGIDASLRVRTADIDFDSTIPSVLREQPKIARRIRAELQTYATNHVLYSRFLVVARKNAALFSELREKFTRDTVPLDVLERAIGRVSHEEGWTSHIPSASTMRSRLFQCSLAYYKGMMMDEGSSANVSSFGICGQVGSPSSSRVTTNDEPPPKKASMGSKSLEVRASQAGRSPVSATAPRFSQPAAPNPTSYRANARSHLQPPPVRNSNSSGPTSIASKLSSVLSSSGLFPKPPTSIPVSPPGLPIPRSPTGTPPRMSLPFSSPSLAPLRRGPSPHSQRLQPSSSLPTPLHSITTSSALSHGISPIASTSSHSLFTKSSNVQEATKGWKNTVPVVTVPLPTPSTSGITRTDRGSGMGLEKEQPEVVILEEGSKEDGPVATTTPESARFVAAMKDKIKEMTPEALAAVMTKINEHLQARMVAQLAEKVLANFDPHQHAEVFSEILGIIDGNTPKE